MSVFERQDDKSIRPWCKWSWDPITGCQYACTYCPAIEKFKKLYSRTRNEAYNSFEPRLWPERFDAPESTTLPETNTSGNRNVLVGQMGDIFGEWVEKEHLDTILDLVRQTPQWNYIFLTKNAKRYLEFELPQNCWAGVKVDTQHEVKPAIEAFTSLRAPVRYVSCDPMVTWLQFPTLECFDWMILGPRPKTKSRPAFIPPKLWIDSVAKQAKKSGCRIFAKHLNKPGLNEFPGGNGGS